MTPPSFLIRTSTHYERLARLLLKPMWRTAKSSWNQHWSERTSADLLGKF